MKRHRSLIFTDLTIHMLMVLLVLFPADDDEAKVSEKNTILNIGCFVKRCEPFTA